MKLGHLFLIIMSVVIAATVLTTCVFATEPQLYIEGDNTICPGESKTLTIKFSAEEEVGMISGKIEKSSNITSMVVTGKNGWNLTYNENTGLFNIYKAEGAKTAEIIEILYTASSTEGTGNITISNLKMTTIKYETIEKENVVKNITIEDLKVTVNTYIETTESGVKYINNISPNTSIAQFLQNIETNGDVKIYQGQAEITDNTKKIGTGMTIKISLNNKSVEYQTIVTGDLSGNGEMGDVDVLRMARYKAGLETLNGAYLKASDINKNGQNADDIDLLKMVRTLVGLD